MKKNVNISAIVFAVLFVASVSYSISIAQTGNILAIDYKHRFETSTGKQREKIAHNLVEERNQISESLINGLDSKDMDVKYYSAAVLGFYRCSEASGKLSDMITLEDPQFYNRSRGKLWYWSQYPAVDALIHIGNDSISGLENNLATSDDPKVRDLSLWTIKYIEKDLHVTKAELNRAISKETDVNRIKHLKKAIAVVDAEISSKAHK